MFGRIATGDQFVSDKEKKSAIQVCWSRACVVLVGVAVAVVCWIYEIAFVIIRCMSDMADDDGESTYSFNENEAASLSGSLVLSMLDRF